MSSELASLNKAQISTLLSNHEKWIESNGKAGAAAKFERVNLSGFDFSHRKLSHATFIECNLENSSFTFVSAENLSFLSCNLDVANFSESKISRSTFNECKISDIQFFSAELHKVTFNKLDGMCEIFIKSRLSDCKFLSCVLDGADFSNSKLIGVNFEHSSCSVSEFRESKLTECKFINTNLDGSEFYSTTLDSCTFFESSIIDYSPQSGVNENLLKRIHYKKELIKLDFTNISINNCNFSKAIISDELQEIIKSNTTQNKKEEAVVSINYISRVNFLDKISSLLFAAIIVVSVFSIWLAFFFIKTNISYFYIPLLLFAIGSVFVGILHAIHIDIIDNVKKSKTEFVVRSIIIRGIYNYSLSKKVSYCAIIFFFIVPASLGIIWIINFTNTIPLILIVNAFIICYSIFAGFYFLLRIMKEIQLADKKYV